MTEQYQKAIDYLKGEAGLVTTRSLSAPSISQCPRDWGLAPVEIPMALPRTRGIQETAMDDLMNPGKLIRAYEARDKFEVTGTGLTVAVIDTGIRTTHKDFEGKIKAQVDFCTKEDRLMEEMEDANGHGTHVSSTLLGRGIHTGIAPDAEVVALKVVGGRGHVFSRILRALKWVLAHYDSYGISAVSMSIGNNRNYTDDSLLLNHSIMQCIQALHERHIPVIVAAGNSYVPNGAVPGMNYPAITRYCISVGCVFISNIGRVEHGRGGVSYTSAENRIVPFSQRLPREADRAAATSVFAPGSFVRAAGYSGDYDSAVMEGTSMAAPVVSGLVLLLQNYYQKVLAVETFPSVPVLLKCLQQGAESIIDGDDENDSVANTGATFQRVDALGALIELSKYLLFEIRSQEK